MNKLFNLLLFLSISLNAQDKELSLISWNIQDFGKTKDQKEIERIATIIKDADIIAIQEVVAGYGGPQAIARLWDQLNRLGSSWGYIVSDKTDSPKYMTERYAFLWKKSKVKIKKTGQLIVTDTLVYREPYKADFFIGKKRISILNYHARRHNLHPENEIILLSKYAQNSLSQPAIIAGDFNLKHTNHAFSNFFNSGYQAVLNNQKTVLKRSCKNNEYLNHAIDNIFCSDDIQILDAKVIDHIGFCDRLLLARQLSDHLPVYIRFKLK